MSPQLELLQQEAGVDSVGIMRHRQLISVQINLSLAP